MSSVARMRVAAGGVRVLSGVDLVPISSRASNSVVLWLDGVPWCAHKTYGMFRSDLGRRRQVGQARPAERVVNVDLTDDGRVVVTDESTGLAVLRVTPVLGGVASEILGPAGSPGAERSEVDFALRTCSEIVEHRTRLLTTLVESVEALGRDRDWSVDRVTVGSTVHAASALPLLVRSSEAVRVVVSPSTGRHHPTSTHPVLLVSWRVVRSWLVEYELPPGGER